MIAGKGFEPHDLRVMSPTSYQTALPRDIILNERCRTPGSNRYDTFVSRDFKSRASANSATPAYSRHGLLSLPANYNMLKRICQYPCCFLLTLTSNRCIMQGSVFLTISGGIMSNRPVIQALCSSLPCKIYARI